MELEPFDLGWLVGFLEGEGCFQAPPPSNANLPRVIGVTTDRDVAERAARLMGVRAIGSPPSRQKQPHYRQQFVVMRAGEPARHLMRLLQPHMGARRRAAIEKALRPVARQAV